MARGKKKESALTPEEKLAQALVPVDEQPYKVPGNWCFFFFTSLIDVEGGTQPPKSQFIDEPRDGYARLIQIRDFATDKYTVYVPDTPKMRHLEENDILIARYGASLGRICTGQKGVYNVALAKTIFSEFVLNRKYVYWMLQSETFQNPLTQLSRTAQAGFNKDDLSGFAMPLAPLAEQQRIVDRIEYLFAKLDEAKEKAQSVLDSFETRKAAILHKAFIGELTAKWRTEHGVEGTWKTSTVGDTCHEVKVGIVIKPSQYYTDAEHGTPAFRSANVRENHIDDFDWVYLNDIGMENNKRSIVHTGDVLVVRSGNPGTACVVSEKFDGYNAIDILIAVPNQNLITPEFLCCYTNSPFGKNLVSENKRGMALAHFNVKGYSGLPIRIPTLGEQTEIVRILDSLFAKEQQAKEAAEAVLEKIDLLKKSILARAFRGELGTNDPTEESALELLKIII